MAADEEIGHLGRVICGVVAGVAVVANKVMSQGASGLKSIFEALYQDTDAAQ